jgi:hypothetical protein
LVKDSGIFSISGVVILAGIIALFTDSGLRLSEEKEVISVGLWTQR